MKKIILSFLALFFLTSVALNAQERWTLGLRAGANLATITGDDTPELETNTRFVGGLTATYSVNETAGIGLGLLYSGEGAKTVREAEQLNFTYLRVPITFNYYFGNLGDDFRPKVYLGLAPGFLLNAEVNDFDVKSEYNTFDLGGMAGLGFNYRIAPSGTWLQFDLRYMRGLSDLTVSDNAEIYNQSWQPTIGIVFGI